MGQEEALLSSHFFIHYNFIDTNFHYTHTVQKMKKKNICNICRLIFQAILSNSCLAEVLPIWSSRTGPGPGIKPARLSPGNCRTPQSEIMCGTHSAPRAASRLIQCDFHEF